MDKKATAKVNIFKPLKKKQAATDVAVKMDARCPTAGTPARPFLFFHQIFQHLAFLVTLSYPKLRLKASGISKINNSPTLSDFDE